MILKKKSADDDALCLTDGKNSAWFEFIDAVCHKGNEYVALVEENTEQILILKDISQDGEEAYETVDDDESFYAVEKLFKHLFDEEDR